ncbi:SRPBCC family protein [candidate division CSSED10-310 bacterium]|uniref:SRPBCC family protein n=1 Tax=candidate division CSSED10-310 bacterium TaxID=2855610 RepID=A0ABV6Z450_UNCC1
MTVSVPFDIHQTFTVKASYDTVFDLLANVPESVSHFPKVDNLVDLGNNVYRWEMEKLGAGKYIIQTIYACQYSNNRDQGWIRWTPLKDVGNALIEGSWQIKKLSGSTAIDFYTKGIITAPLPSLTKLVVSPIVSGEFKNLIENYIRNLEHTLNS